ncbi:MAG: hypothetical protein FWK04_02060 [Nostoc sp. GBBB01]|nr:hypothetical protein [Nostoc sp. GBBB01]
MSLVIGHGVWGIGHPFGFAQGKWALGIGHKRLQGLQGQRRKTCTTTLPILRLRSVQVSPSPLLPLSFISPSPYATKHNATDNQKLNKVL